MVVAALGILTVTIVLAVLGNRESDFAIGWIAESGFDTEDEALIEQGRYLALAGNCAACHTNDAGGEMAGGVPFNTPFGVIYSTNITPDVETGIGSWTDLDFLNSMRHGLRPGGEHLYPAFPYTAFAKLTDDDVAALYAYLKSIPAVQQPNPENDMAFPFNQRRLMSLWKGMFFESEVFVGNESRSDAWNRGAYLVEGLAHCGECHTPRNRFGAKRKAREMAGGEYIDSVRSGESKPWFAPNLTSATHGLGLWPEKDIAAYLKTGRNQFVETFGPMNEVIMLSTRHLSTDDVNAMANYLHSLPPVEDGNRKSPTEREMGMGRTVYNLHCGTCHLPTGLGDEKMAPQIAQGSLVVNAENPASLINVILYGPETAEPPLPEKWRNPMEEFQYLLDDQEVAALASYLRSSWGNAGGVVEPDQVARQR